MAKAIAYNTLGTKTSRIIAVFDAADMSEAILTATRWNRDEDRPNMMVNFVAIGATVRPLTVISAPLFEAAA